MLFTNGCSRSWVAVGRPDGLHCKHCLMKFLPSSERWSGIVGICFSTTTLNIAVI
ncbi:hypothetical protein Hanom_Chr06g00493131 [Helianthus anomalus]